MRAAIYVENPEISEVGGSIFRPFGGEWSRKNLLIKSLNIVSFAGKIHQFLLYPAIPVLIFSSTKIVRIW